MRDLNQELSLHLVRDCLVCPVCHSPLSLTPDGHSLVCGDERKPHCFDGASGGYIPLAHRHPGGGDSKEAVRARTGFLSAGYYAPAADALTSIVGELCPAGGDLLDAGCGEGYYSNRLAAAGFSVLGADLSKFAVDAAAKGARVRRLSGNTPSRTVFCVGSVFELPVRDASFELVTNVFAPCAPDEYARVLKPGGHLIVAGAGETHLMGLKRVLYDDPYVNEGRRDLPDDSHPALTLVGKRNVTFDVTVKGREDIAALFSMTPYYWRTSQNSRARLDHLDTLETPVSFDFHIYRKA